MQFFRTLTNFAICFALLLVVMAAWGAFGYVAAFDRNDGTSAPMEMLP